MKSYLNRTIYPFESDLFMVKDPIPKELFDILACPICKKALKYNKDKTKLVCSKCSNEYDIKDGIPILLPPEEEE